MTTDNRTTLNACDANTNWTGDDGTPTSVTASGLYYENANSLSFQHSDADEHTYYTDGTGWDLSDATAFLIVKVNQQDTQANGGMKYVLGDGTDRVGVEVGGSDNPGVQLSNLFYGLAIAVTNRTAFTQHVFAGVAANLTTTAITQVGYGSFHLAKAQGAVDNVYLDRLSYIANDSAVLTINGGTSGTPETWSDVVGDDSTNGWGVCGNPFASQFQINCSFDIGDTAAADSYFTMSGEQLYLFGTYYGATHFFWGLQSNSGQTNQLVIDGSQVISVAGTTGSPCDLNWNNANFNNIQVDGSLFVDLGNITLPANSATRWIRTSTLENPTRITPNGMEISDCTLNAGANTNANGLMLLDTSGDSNQCANLDFVSDGSGHAIEISVAGTYDFDNFQFSGYGADGTTDAEVYISVNAAVTINIQNGGATPTVRNSGTAPTINNSVTVTVDGVAEGTAVKVIADETAGTVTKGDTVLQGLADSTGKVETTTFNYEAAFGAGLDVLVRARSQGLPTAAISDDGGAFTDETTAANSSTADDMTLLPAGAVAGDNYYFGHPEQYSRIKVNVSQGGVGGTNPWTAKGFRFSIYGLPTPNAGLDRQDRQALAYAPFANPGAGAAYSIQWQYYNGTIWTNLSGVSDGTDSFKTEGENIVSFTIPGDWSTTTVNSQGPYYYIRANFVSGTLATQPLGRYATMDVTRYLPIPQQGVLRRTITSNGLTASLSQAVDSISKFDPND